MHLDAFLSITNANAIAGESTDGLAGMTNTIEVLQYGFSMFRAARTSIEVQPLSIVKPLDSASPLLARAMTTGSQLGTVTLSICQPASSPTANPAKIVLYKIVLTNAWISLLVHLGEAPSIPATTAAPFVVGSIWTCPSVMGQGPVELVQFSYSTIAWTYNGATGNGGAAVTYALPSLASGSKVKSD